MPDTIEPSIAPAAVNRDSPEVDAPRGRDIDDTETLDPKSHDARREDEQHAARRHRDARRVGRRVLQAVSDHRRALTVVATTVAGIAVLGGLTALAPRLLGRSALRRATPLIAQALPTAIRATALTLGVPPFVAAPLVLVARTFARRAN
jgi:broad specificity phosphatase PhoE